MSVLLAGYRNVSPQVATFRTALSMDVCDDSHRGVRPTTNQLQSCLEPTFHGYFRQVSPLSDRRKMEELHPMYPLDWAQRLYRPLSSRVQPRRFWLDFRNRSKDPNLKFDVALNIVREGKIPVVEQISSDHDLLRTENDN